MNEQKDQILDYVYSFETPAETDFFTDRQKDVLKKEEAKFAKTQEYLTAVVSNPDLGGKIEQDIATGSIYSQGEMNKILSRRQAMEGSGERSFPNRSLISPTGQRVIMSEHCSEMLGFLTDGYVFADELEDLVNILKSEGLLDDQLVKVRDAMGKYKAVILQRGAYEALFDLLAEVAPHDLTKIKPFFEGHTASLDQLLAKASEAQRPEIKPTTIPVPKPQAPKSPAASALVPRKIIPPDPSKLKQLQSLDKIQTVDDLQNVRVDHLRQGPLTEQIRIIKSKVIQLAHANKVLPFYLVEALEQSPLYQSYMTTGSNLIADENPNRKAAFEQAADKSKSMGSEVLSQEEFEAVADLRQQIAKL